MSISSLLLLWLLLLFGVVGAPVEAKCCRGKVHEQVVQRSLSLHSYLQHFSLTCDTLLMFIILMNLVADVMVKAAREQSPVHKMKQTLTAMDKDSSDTVSFIELHEAPRAVKLSMDEIVSPKELDIFKVLVYGELGEVIIEELCEAIFLASLHGRKY